MELIDIVDENNQLTGEKCERKELHEKGLWYRAVFVIVMNSKNELLFQKRTSDRKIHPNKWGITGGHVDSEESERVAAARETQEEIGIENLDPKDLEFLCVKKIVRKYGNVINNHFKNIFLLRTDLKIDEFVPQKSELSELKYFSIDEIKNICQNKEKYEKEFIPTFFDDYFLEILEKLEKGENNMRKKVIAGNWKMNMLPNEAIEYIQEFEGLVKDTKNEVILCVPYTDLFYCLNFAQGTNIKIGAQNMHWEEKGAYTGEVSAQMLKSIGVEYVILGHSERRQYFAENDETVNQKIKAAFASDLKPIVCVGETLEQREAGKTAEIITTQTRLALEGLTSDQVKNTVIAYEPIWAIGTGKTATSEDANNSIKEIRQEIEKNYGKEVADEVIIQYGGSVKSSNAKELFSMSDIDGGLVGGASLKPDEFAKIVNFDK